MKTTTLLLLFFLFAGRGLAQESAGTKYFAQCMVNITDETNFRILEDNLRQNPNVAVVRLDWVTKRAFVLTNNLEHLTESDFASWFGVASSHISCIQTGVYGVDEIAKYPFANCSNE